LIVGVSKTPAFIIASLRSADAAKSLASRVLSIEDDHNPALVTIGGVVDSWIDKARRPLHFDMPIEDGAPLAVVPHLMTDNHHSHGILPLLPATNSALRVTMFER